MNMHLRRQQFHHLKKCWQLFFDGMLLMGCLEKEKTITGLLNDVIKEKHSHMAKKVLFQNNAPSHTSAMAKLHDLCFKLVDYPSIF